MFSALAQLLSELWVSVPALWWSVCVIKHKNCNRNYYPVTKQFSNHCNKMRHTCSNHIWTFSLAPDSFCSRSLLYPAFYGAPLNSFPGSWNLTKFPHPEATSSGEEALEGPVGAWRAVFRPVHLGPHEPCTIHHHFPECSELSKSQGASPKHHALLFHDENVGTLS